MNKFYTLLILPFLLLFNSHILKANHVLGMDLTYRTLNSNQIEVKLVKIRYCGGTTLSATANYSVYNDSFLQNYTMTRVSIEEIISPYCSPVCQPQNTVSGNGREAHTYLDTLDLSSGNAQKFVTDNYCKLKFSAGECCISNGLLGQENYMVDAMLDLCLWRKSAQQVSSGDFLFPQQQQVPLTSTFSYSFAMRGYSNLDSLNYSLVLVRKDTGSFLNVYSPSRPLGYLCPNAGSSCAFNPDVNPVTGFKFDNKNGNFIITARSSGGVAVRVDLYRVVDGVRQIIGYSKRIMANMEFYNTAQNYPFRTSWRDLTMKVGKKTCVNIEFSDVLSVNQTTKDTQLLSIVSAPSEGTISLLDSSSAYKTLVFCHTPTTTDYHQRKSYEIVVKINEKGVCSQLANTLSTSIRIELLKPDSNAHYNVRTFKDDNMNGVKDGTEPYISAKLHSFTAGKLKFHQTDLNGYLRDSFQFGEISFYAPVTPEYRASEVYTINGVFRDVYDVEIALQPRTAVKGTVYLDLNNNCQKDAGEPPVKGVRIEAEDNENFAYTNDSGVYFLPVETGPHKMHLNTAAYSADNCSNEISVNIPTGQIVNGVDFFVTKVTNYKNLAIQLKTANPINDSSVLEYKLIVANTGQLTAKQVFVKFLTDKTLPGLQSSFTIYKSFDTSICILDSIRPGQIREIPLSFRLPAGLFPAGSHFCMEVMLPEDDLESDNYTRFCQQVQTATQLVPLKLSLNGPSVLNHRKTLSYSIRSNPSVSYPAGLYIIDTLDVELVNPASLKVLENTGSFQYTLNNEELILTYPNSVSIGVPFVFTYSVDLREEIDSVFKIVNKVVQNGEGGKIITSEKVTDITSEAFTYTGVSDTTICRGDGLTVFVRANFKLGLGNRIKVELSDMNGDFNGSTEILDTAISTQDFGLNLKFPFFTVPGSDYRIRLVSSHPEARDMSNQFPYTLELNNNPIPFLAILEPKPYYCQGDTISTLAFGGDTFEFYVNYQSARPADTSNRYSFVPATNSIISVKVTDINGCTGTTEDELLQLNSMSKPVLGIQPDSICQGETVELFVTHADSFDIYIDDELWKSQRTGKVNTPELYDTSVIRVVGYNEYLCKAEVSDSVYVWPLPAKPVVTVLPTSLRSSYTYGNQWNLDGNKVDSAIRNVFFPPKSGVYTVLHTDFHGCRSLSDTVHFHNVSVKSLSKLSLVKVYPNPNNGSFSIEYTGDGEIQYQLIAADGRVLDSEILTAGNYHLVLDWIHSGIYTLLIQRGNEFYTDSISIIR